MAKFYTPTRLSENIAETPEGYLLCAAVPIARTGWQEYGQDETPLETGPDGIINIYRDAKEVFRPQTIASFQGKSITIKHPEDFVAPDNWSDLTKGTLQNVRKSDELGDDGEECLVADLLITEKMAIQLVKNGLREVSCGYECEYEQTGEGEGRQFNIVGNHCALVEEGRAGSSYAINDHKGKVNMDPKKIIEKLKAKLGAKVVDEAMKDEEKKDDKAKDANAYDELVKMVKDLGVKMDALGGAKDEEKKDDEKKSEDEEEKKNDSKDEEKKDDEKKSEDDEEKKDGDEAKDDEASMEERLKALEAAVSKLLDKKTGDEEEKSEDEDKESEDDDFEDSEMTGDAARIEILAPGTKFKGKDAKKKALQASYATKDGKKVIDSLSAGKKPTFDSESLFIAAAELLKAQRGTGLEGSKNPKGFESFDSKTEVMTADKMNELNAAHWAVKK